MGESKARGDSGVRMPTATVAPAVPKRSLDQFAAFDLLDDPCWLLELDPPSVCWANPAALALWAASSLAELQCGFLAAAFDRLANYRRLIAEARDGDDEWPLRRDGPAPSVSCRLRPVRLSGRGPALLVRVVALPGGLAEQQRKRTQDQARLAASEERFRGFAEAASEWFWETDAGGRFTYVSPGITPATGSRPEDLVGLTRQEMAKASGRAETLEEYQPLLAAMAARRPFVNVVAGLTNRAGALVHVSTSGRPRFDAAGNFLGYRGAGRNITAQVEAERRLAASEQRFRDFVDVSADWYWELDCELKFSFVSASVLERTGRDPAALTGTRPRKERTRGMSDEAWQAHEDDLAARRPFIDFRFDGLDGQGRERHFTSSGKPVFDAAGRFLGYRGTGRDVTALVDAEKRLRASEASLREVIDTVPAMISVKDADHRYLMMNSYQARLMGTTPADAIGKRADELLPQEAGNHVGDRDQVVIDGGVAIGPYETRFRCADGVTRVWLTQKTPLEDGEGRLRAILTVAADITAQKDLQAALVATQEKLLKSEERFRDFAEIGSDVTWEMGADLRITYVSDSIEPITGTPAADYVGKRNIDLAPDDPRREAIERLLENRRAIRDYPFSRPTRDGRVVHLMYSAKPVLGDGGEFLGYRGTIRDITAQREAEIETARLRKVRDVATAADMAKTRFLANMSHELRTPLNAILGFSEILRGEMFGPLGAAPYRGYARDIESSGRRLLDIINDLLDMSRIQLGEFAVSPEPVGVAALVEDSIAAARSLAPAADASCKWAPVAAAPVDPAWIIEVDPRALRQVLVKLLSNALKFTLPAGRVGVDFRLEPGGAVSLCVADTGCGITPERMATLFEPFQLRGAEHTRTGNGAGLGLWVSRALIELHGGTLTLRSSLGEGTVATMTLPALRVRQGPPQLRIAS